jgi:hypothetical protein
MAVSRPLSAEFGIYLTAQVSMVISFKSSRAHLPTQHTKPAPFIRLKHPWDETPLWSTQEATSSCDSKLIIQIRLSYFIFTILKLIISARIQLFHCHIEWHVEAGLIATLVEAPDVLQDTQSIPHDHYQVCKSQNIPTKGNAAGNTQNWLDLTGANTNISTNDYGYALRPALEFFANENTELWSIHRREREGQGSWGRFLIRGKECTVMHERDKSVVF